MIIMGNKSDMIVTIDREVGSGGHEVARRLADRLGLKLYDEEIIAKAAEKTGYHEEYIKNNEERAPEYSLAGFFSAIDSFQTSPFAQLQEEESEIIREIASEGGCVIVGRAADYILSEERHISIFLFAPIEDRVKRKLALARMDQEGEELSEAAVEKEIRAVDRQRRRFYEFYTDNKWGSREVYDLLINTGRSGINGAVDIIEAYIRGGRDKDILSDM
jgi:cytidylate kinase